MKTRIALVLAVLFVIGFVVSVETVEVKASSELSISSAPEATSLNCGKDGCAKKAECKKSDKAGCSKAKASGDKAESSDSTKKTGKAKGGCSKGK
jgi:hypothetical protein